jgi:hypothetical protein
METIEPWSLFNALQKEYPHLYTLDQQSSPAEVLQHLFEQVYPRKWNFHTEILGALTLFYICPHLPHFPLLCFFSLLRFRLGSDHQGLGRNFIHAALHLSPLRQNSPDAKGGR